MIDTVIAAVYLSFPLVLAGFIHMYIVKKNYLSFLNKPLSLRLFGRNKTWRGFVVIVLFSILGVYVLSLVPTGAYVIDEVEFHNLTYPLWILGALLGLFCALFELPNSYMKRRIGIPEGKPAPRFPLVFSLIDQSDSVVGCLLVYALFFDVSWSILLALFVLGTFIHLATNIGLWTLGLRKEPF